MTYADFCKFDAYITKEYNYYTYVSLLNNATEEDTKKYNHFKEVKERIKRFKIDAICNALKKHSTISKEFFEKTLDK